MILLYFIGISAISFLLFGIDKWKATQHRGRISEFILLLVSFFGGSLGSLLAMIIFRHKISKTSFKIKFGLILLAQILVILYFIKEKI